MSWLLDQRLPYLYGQLASFVKMIFWPAIGFEGLILLIQIAVALSAIAENTAKINDRLWAISRGVKYIDSAIRSKSAAGNADPLAFGLES